MLGQDCIVDIDTSRSQADVGDCFASCGRILGIYPWKIDRYRCQHYFIEFAHPESVAKACTKANGDFGVRALTSDPALLDRFISVIPPDKPRKAAEVSGRTSAHSHTPEHHSPTASTHNRVRRASAQAKVRQAIKTDLPSICDRQGSLPTPPRSAEGREDGHESTSLDHHLDIPDIALSTPPELPEDRHKDPKPSSRESLLSPPKPSTSQPISVPLSGITPSQAVIPSGLPPLLTTMVMSFCGESISFDLNTLDDDPEAIVSLLKTTSSDRDKWMLVGASYRRLGKVSAAVAVMTSMIEVMKTYGMSDCDIKPAFLMLSSCQAELGKRARTTSGKETEASTAHMEKSRQWLQRIYGTAVPELADSSNTAVVGALGLDLPRNGTSGPSTDSGENAHHPQSPQPTLSEVELLYPSPQSVLHASHSRSRTAPGIPTGPRRTPAPTSPHHKASLALERDLQILRDRHASQVVELNSMRTAKRKVEDECVQERILRRKLERTLQDVETQLERTQKLEDAAREQVRWEVQARRKAEELVEQERAMRVEAEEKGKRDVRPLFEGLAGIFQRAAQQGDVAGLVGAMIAPGPSSGGVSSK
ncbi:hypothetical protein BV25DRAFT_1991122 [Artomyces pyxidatus]|uniref:Uncharacterized protein n=1 Tax=Artomyces pyxidatus TaxID=48021 RepID=A0ACB8T2B7_9AGAM|nr:hypothetical protein BV25DRAFT_1991122 [Artomyces pyxidatus]